MKLQYFIPALAAVLSAVLSVQAQSIENMVNTLGTSDPSAGELLRMGFQAERQDDGSVFYSNTAEAPGSKLIMMFGMKNDIIRAVAVMMEIASGVDSSLTAAMKKEVRSTARKKKFRVQDLGENGARAQKGSREFGIVFLTPQVLFIYATDTGTDFFMPE